MQPMELTRRALLHKSAIASALGLGSVLLPTAFARASTSMRWDRTLVMIKLNGGNDGLNTVIPYTDPLYYHYRQRVAIPREQVAHLTDTIGLHPSLAPLLPRVSRRA